MILINLIYMIYMILINLMIMVIWIVSKFSKWNISKMKLKYLDFGKSYSFKIRREWLRNYIIL